MFSQNGLSLDQAPPISVIFRFFLLGSLFGILAGVSIFFYNHDIFHPVSVGARTFTHLLTLGVMLSFMFAALFQMLPVIAGVKLSSPHRRANILLVPFSLGVFSLLIAFNTSLSWLYLLAAFLLTTAIVATVIPMLIELSKLSHHTSSSKGMFYALIILTTVVGVGIYLISSLANLNDASYYLTLKKAHYSFGLWGWISLLIISISFQVIEMFYVTPPYPTIITKYLTMTIFTLLVISAISALFIPTIWIFTDTMLALLLGIYALLTLRRLTQKKRPLSDATVWFWRLGLTSLLLSLFFMMIESFTHATYFSPLSYIFFSSFALSIVFAMFYKIIPFLTWFHLSSKGYFTAPMMHEVIHPKTAKKHLYIHLITVVTFVLSLFIPFLIFIAGVLTILSFGWMGYQVIHAWQLYRDIEKNGEQFNMQ